MFSLDRSLKTCKMNPETVANVILSDRYFNQCNMFHQNVLGQGTDEQVVQTPAQMIFLENYHRPKYGNFIAYHDVADANGNAYNAIDPAFVGNGVSNDYLNHIKPSCSGASQAVQAMAQAAYSSNFVTEVPAPGYGPF
eukprot:Pgem_evm3s12025